MKWAKSVKVKKRARACGSCGTGLSGWRCGELGDDPWRGRPHVVHVQLGLGQAGDEGRQVGSWCRVGAHGGPVCRNPVAARQPGGWAGP